MRGFLIIWEGRTGSDAVEGVGLNCFMGLGEGWGLGYDHQLVL
jgi:hypothetical protein